MYFLTLQTKMLINKRAIVLISSLYNVDLDEESSLIRSFLFSFIYLLLHFIMLWSLSNGDMSLTIMYAQIKSSPALLYV